MHTGPLSQHSCQARLPSPARHGPTGFVRDVASSHAEQHACCLCSQSPCVFGVSVIVPLRYGGSILVDRPISAAVLQGSIPTARMTQAVGPSPAHVTPPRRAYAPTRWPPRSERSSAAFERAATLFNLGAVSSQLAIGADLTSDAGVKTAARSFQARPDPGPALLLTASHQRGSMHAGSCCGHCPALHLPICCTLGAAQ